MLLWSLKVCTKPGESVFSVVIVYNDVVAKEFELLSSTKPNIKDNAKVFQNYLKLHLLMEIGFFGTFLYILKSSIYLFEGLVLD